MRGAGRRALSRRLALGRLSAGFLPPGESAQAVFRGKFLALLGNAFDRGKLSFHGKLRALADVGAFRHRLAVSAQTDWVVYAKPPWGGPEQVLKYLARYTHRVAISNRRLVALEDGEVTFHWKSYADGGGQKTMTLKATEFIRRFLLHVLPTGFVRIRHYGFLANRVCQEKLAQCRALLGVEATPEPIAAECSAEPRESLEEVAGAKVCPSCGAGRMVLVATVRALPGEPEAVGTDRWSGRIRYVLSLQAWEQQRLRISAVATTPGGDRGFPVCRAEALAQNAVEEALGGRKVGHSHHSYTTGPRWVPRFPAASNPAKALGLD